MKLSFLADFYPWIKALHVMAIIAWMAALLYLPRLFVYHCEVLPGSREGERFKLMERRLYKQIMTPAMIAAWLFGILLVLTPGSVSLSDGWFHVKLLCVVALSGVHGAMGSWRRAFLQDRNRRPQRFYRIMNEVPAALMVVIVIMVIVRPF